MGKSRALIIGGAGFIGSHLADVCAENGLEVWVYDNFSTGRKGFLKKIPRENILEGDILDGEKLASAMREADPEIVFHLAAVHHIPTCEKKPGYALRVNVEGTASVLEALQGIGAKKVVFASTGALYDPSNEGVLSENSPLKAFDIYSISKMACERLLEYHSKKTGIEAIAARLFNTVGRRETNSHLIPAIIEQLISGKRRIQLGNVTPRRDYIHVEDVAEALFALGKTETKKPFDAFNVGTGIEHSVLELVNLFSEVIGEPVEVVSVSERQRKVDRPTQKADQRKLEAATKWKAKRTLRQALDEVWKESLEKASG